jgi:hypothetical protein
MVGHNANLSHDLEAYLSNNNRFKFHIHDMQEVEYIADHLGSTPDSIRYELKKLGYRLIKNRYGRVVWKKEVDSQAAKTKNNVCLEEYLARYETRQIQFYDKSEVARIAHRTENNPDHVRSVLKRKGYRLIKNPHGIAVWIKGDNINHFRQFLVLCFCTNCYLLGHKFIDFLHIL